jgi:rod shape-determining protein MreC
VADYLNSTRRGRRRDVYLASAVLAVALILLVLPAAYQEPVRQTVRNTALRPFISAQSGVVAQRGRRVNVTEVRAQRDSLSAVLAAQVTLAEENRRLRSLLGLRQRAEDTFIPAEVVRVGMPGAESTFLLNVGTADGVFAGSPIVAAEGLLGVVWDATDRTAHAIDWTHPDFRASAMTADGRVFGRVEPRRGEFREADVLTLTGAPFHTDIPRGTRVVTSGRGGVYPRGIPIGTVVEIGEADTGWRKSYVLRPLVTPGSTTHVLVGVRPEGERSDLSQLWQTGAPLPDLERPATAAAGRSGGVPGP